MRKVVYDVSGLRMLFNFDAFRRIFSDRASKEKKLGRQYETIVGEATGLGPSKIHEILLKNTSPDDLAQVKKIAEAWQIGYLTLLIPQEQPEKKSELTDRELEAVRRIYRAISEFNRMFFETDGLFVDEDGGSYLAGGIRTDSAYREYRKVLFAFRCEYIDLKNHPIYEDFWNYINGGLREMFVGRLEKSSRYDVMQNGKPIDVDYNEASEKLIALIDKYI